MIKTIELKTYGWANDPEHPEKHKGTLTFKVPRQWLIKKLGIKSLKEFIDWMDKYIYDDSLHIYNMYNMEFKKK